MVRESPWRGKGLGLLQPALSIQCWMDDAPLTFTQRSRSVPAVCLIVHICIEGSEDVVQDCLVLAWRPTMRAFDRALSPFNLEIQYELLVFACRVFWVLCVGLVLCSVSWSICPHSLCSFCIVSYPFSLSSPYHSCTRCPCDASVRCARSFDLPIGHPAHSLSRSLRSPCSCAHASYTCSDSC